MKKTFTIIGLALTVVGSVFGLTGCGDQATAPLNSQNNGLNALAWVDSSGADPFATSHGSVTPAGVVLDLETVPVTPFTGGVVDLDLGTGESKLIIPPGAVRLPVVITALAVQIPTPFGTLTLYEFGPDGLTFKKAAKLELEVNEANGTVRTLFWYNPSNNRWEAQEAAAVKDGKVIFNVYHFSKYGIS